MVTTLYSSKHQTVVGENFEICSVQITAKCIDETPPLPWHDLIIIPYVEYPHQFTPKSLSPHEKFFWEESPFILSVGHKFYDGNVKPILCISKVFSSEFCAIFQSSFAVLNTCVEAYLEPSRT